MKMRRRYWMGIILNEETKNHPPSNWRGGKKTDRTTYTDNQVAKKASVGTGTVARYNRVMSTEI